MPQYARYAFANGSGTSRTVTFSEGTALGSDHVLLAFHYHNQSSDPTTPSGWTLITSYNTGSRRLYVYGRRGNGVVNSFSLTTGTSNVNWGSALFAYETPETGLTIGDAGAIASTTNGTSISLSEMNPGGYGVSVAWGWIAAGGTSRVWSPGFTEVVTQSGIYPAAERLGSTPFTPSLSWSGSTLRGLAVVTVPLPAPPPPEPVGDAIEYLTWDGTSLTPLEPVGAWKGA